MCNGEQREAKPATNVPSVGEEQQRNVNRSNDVMTGKRDGKHEGNEAERQGGKREMMQPAAMRLSQKWNAR